MSEETTAPSVFATPLDCTRGLLECLSQNYWTTPPYGPIPDATYKLRLAAGGMIDALIIAMDAESRGETLPAVPVKADSAGMEVLRVGNEPHRHGLAANTPERTETPARQQFHPPVNTVLPSTTQA